MLQEKQHYYTLEFYEKANLEPFLHHTDLFLRGKETVPVSKTRIEHSSHEVFFTFSNELLDQFLKNPASLQKPYEKALKFGLRGYSRGGKNGIFFVRDEDDGLLRAIPRLVARDQAIISDDLNVTKEGLDALKYVKIVWHNPSGERVVGVYNSINYRILFLDFARY